MSVSAVMGILSRHAILGAVVALSGCATPPTASQQSVDVTEELKARAQTAAEDRRHVRWQSRLPGDDAEFVEIVAGDTVIVGSMTYNVSQWLGRWVGMSTVLGRVVAYDLASGRELWTRERRAGDNIFRTDVYQVDDLVVLAHQLLGNVPFSVEARDRRSGREIWSYRASSGEQLHMFPLGSLFFTVRAGGRFTSPVIAARELTTGAKLWERTVAAASGASAPELHMNLDEMYVFGEELHRLSPGTGDVLWRVRLPHPGVSVRVVSDGRQLLVAGAAGYSALDSGTGVLRWTRTVEADRSSPGQNPVTLLLPYDDSVIVGRCAPAAGMESCSAHVWTAHAVADGSVRWTRTIAGLDSNVLIDDRRLVFLHRDRLFVLDSATGEINESVAKLPDKERFWPHATRVERVGSRYVAFSRRLVGTMPVDGGPFVAYAIAMPASSPSKFVYVQFDGGRGNAADHYSSSIGNVRRDILVRRMERAGTQVAEAFPGVFAARGGPTAFERRTQAELERIRSNPHRYARIDRQLAVGEAMVAARLGASAGRGQAMADLSQSIVALGNAMQAAGQRNVWMQQATMRRIQDDAYARSFDGRYHYTRGHVMNEYELLIVIDAERLQYAVARTSAHKLDIGEFRGAGEGLAVAVDASSGLAVMEGYGLDVKHMEPRIERDGYTRPPTSLMAIGLDALPYQPLRPVE
jgi:outer membrane protein assembly factor BamB